MSFLGVSVSVSERQSQSPARGSSVRDPGGTYRFDSLLHEDGEMSRAE